MLCSTPVPAGSDDGSASYLHCDPTQTHQHTGPRDSEGKRNTHRFILTYKVHSFHGSHGNPCNQSSVYNFQMRSTIILA